jgi:hypothetical protein
MCTQIVCPVLVALTTQTLRLSAHEATINTRACAHMIFLHKNSCKPPVFAGKPVTVTIPQAMLELPEDSAPITLHIGGWTDDIYRERAEFTRMPELVRL